MLDRLACGREAAEIMGMARSDDVWRAVARHGENYPGPLDVLVFNRMKAAPRDQLRAFAAWYGENVRAGTRWETRGAAAEPEPAAVAGSGKDNDARRAALRAAIGRIEETWYER